MRSEYENAAQALAYFTECQLATVEGVQDRKRFPGYELARHRRIADSMVQTVRAFVLDDKDRVYVEQNCPRLLELLAAVVSAQVAGTAK